MVHCLISLSLIPTAVFQNLAVISPSHPSISHVERGPSPNIISATNITPRSIRNSTFFHRKTKTINQQDPDESEPPLKLESTSDHQHRIESSTKRGGKPTFDTAVPFESMERVDTATKRTTARFQVMLLSTRPHHHHHQQPNPNYPQPPPPPPHPTLFFFLKNQNHQHHQQTNKKKAPPLQLLVDELRPPFKFNFASEQTDKKNRIMDSLFILILCPSSCTSSHCYPHFQLGFTLLSSSLICSMIVALPLL